MQRPPNRHRRVQKRPFAISKEAFYDVRSASLDSKERHFSFLKESYFDSCNNILALYSASSNRPRGLVSIIRATAAIVRVCLHSSIDGIGTHRYLDCHKCGNG